MAMVSLEPLVWTFGQSFQGWSVWRGSCHWLTKIPKRSTVNLLCPIGQPVSSAGENCETSSYIQQRLQKSKNSGSIEHHKSSSIAAISHEGGSFRRQKFASILSQRYFGRPMRLCPCGCQTITFLIQRCPGVAKYCAKFQWRRKQISDHDLDAVCEVKPRTRSFQMWRISCHGNVQSILLGGPTTDRRSWRYATSMPRKSLSTCGLIPCQELIWLIHSVSAIATVVGLALWGYLFSAHLTATPPGHDFQQDWLRQ